MEYEKQKYYYRRKHVSIQLSIEEGTLSDVMILVYCTGTESICVYNLIRYNRKFILIDHICNDLMASRLTDEMAKEKIKELLKNNPRLSYKEILKLTGYNEDRISRFYMITKRGILKNNKIRKY